MTQTAVTSQPQTCPTCSNTGQVQKPIYNTATGAWSNVTETCLDCL
jgi:DnaJ-class molecular chaperone